MYVQFGAASELRVRFRASKIGINTSNFLLTIPRRILCCIYALLLGGGFICDVFYVLFCSSPLFLFVPREGYAVYLWHFLCIFTYFIYFFLEKNCLRI